MSNIHTALVALLAVLPASTLLTAVSAVPFPQDAAPAPEFAFGEAFKLPTIAPGTALGFTPGTEVPFDFVQLNPLNPGAIVTNLPTGGVRLTLKPQGGGVSVKSTQTFNTGSACFTMSTDTVNDLNGIASTAYTLNALSTNVVAQDGSSDEQDLEFFHSASVWQTNTFIKGAGGNEVGGNRAAAGIPHLFCLQNDGTRIRWFQDGKEVTDPRGRKAPFPATFTQDRVMWFSLWNATSCCGGNINPLVTEWTMDVSSFSFYEIAAPAV